MTADDDEEPTVVSERGRLVAVYRALSKALADETLPEAQAAPLRRQLEDVRAELRRIGA